MSNTGFHIRHSQYCDPYVSVKDYKNWKMIINIFYTNNDIRTLSIVNTINIIIVLNTFIIYKNKVLKLLLSMKETLTK